MFIDGCESVKHLLQTTNIWGQILNAKMIYSEPRGSDRSGEIPKDFIKLMNE